MGYITDFALKKDLAGLKKTQREKGVEAVKNAKDLQKNSILHLACTNSNTNSLIYAIRFPSLSNQLILGDIDTIFYALEIGVNVNAINVAGDSPLILSTKKGDIEAIKMLVDAGSKGLSLALHLQDIDVVPIYLPI